MLVKTPMPQRTNVERADLSSQHLTQEVHLMYERGERVIVTGRGSETVLVVWEDRGRGLVLTSDAGYRLALAGDPNAPLVGFPRRDVRGRADASAGPTRV